MSQPNDPPRYEPYQAQPTPGALTCPKCHGAMRTYERHGVHLEQCTSCRGVFLDAGELEHLSAMESALVQQPPTPYGPAWGVRGDQRYRRGGFSSLFFSS
ncbi:MAG TPA: zf-TFIIB domain-containing protein [Propionicimonas sp.]|nr:zf-TFIIB domain-containing protein [Propionicimonas sp.]